MAAHPVSQVVQATLHRWDDNPGLDLRRGYALAIESGKVLAAPDLSFRLDDAERALMDASLVERTRGNLYLRGDGRLGGLPSGDAQRNALQALLQRFAGQARSLVDAVLPHLREGLAQPSTLLTVPRTRGKADSARLRGDALLRLDPDGSPQTRVLRVFSNIDPQGTACVWRLGGDFASLAQRYGTAAVGSDSPSLLARVGGFFSAARPGRSEAGRALERMQAALVRDLDWQRDPGHAQASFPAGTSWLCLPDQLAQATVAAGYVLVQSWQVPVTALAHPEQSPVRVLSRITGRELR